VRRAPRLELAFRDLVQQGLVADLQDARGFSTVPLNALEDFRQRLAFRLLGPAARDVPQAVGARRRRGGRGPADLLAARHQLIEDLLGIVEHNESPDHVLQLADIAAPRILQELRGRRRRKLLVPPVLLVEPRQEALSEDEDLLLALAQRRNANLHDVEAIVEVFTELTAGERLLEIAIGRRHDPGVHVDHPVASDAGEAEVLQDVQELGLEGKGMLRDLVEVDRPLVGVLELARLSAVRPGERALFVAEELRLEEPGGNRGAVDLDEGATAALARQRPDAVLLDVRMPTMNGIEVLRRIRAIDQALPVIIITGLATPSEIAKARELGVTEVIEKSYVLRNFSESLARATNRRPPSS